MCHRSPVTVQRLRPFGETIFAEMSALATSHNAINLGQGFPDADGPRHHVVAAAQQAIADGRNQYPPGLGVPELRRAVWRPPGQSLRAAPRPRHRDLIHRRRHRGDRPAPSSASSEPGDEVVLIEPLPRLLCGDGRHGRREAAPPCRWSPTGTASASTATALAQAFGSKTACRRRQFAAQPDRHGVLRRRLGRDRRAVPGTTSSPSPTRSTRHLLFDGRTHRSIATLPGMREANLAYLQRGEDVQLHRLEGRLGVGPGAPGDGGARSKQFMSYVGSGRSSRRSRTP